MNFDFYMPVRVVSGRTALADSAAQLKKLGDSCMVVTGKCSAKASGALDDLTEVLRREKISCTVYDGITENPLLSSCEEAAALAAEKKAAFVVGIGGGSPLDAAKAIAALAANPGLDREGFFKKAFTVDVKNYSISQIFFSLASQATAGKKGEPGRAAELIRNRGSFADP